MNCDNAPYDNKYIFRYHHFFAKIALEYNHVALDEVSRRRINTNSEKHITEERYKTLEFQNLFTEPSCWIASKFYILCALMV